MSRVDAVLGALLFAGALMLGTWYVPQVVAAGGRPNFYQEMFGPAVMLACGDDYVNPESGVDANLDAFLAVQRDELTCTPGLAAIEHAPLTPMQRAYRYLYMSAGVTWWLQDRVAWSALAPLYGMFFAATVVLLFAVFRQGMGPLLAAALATVLAVSPLHIGYLAHLRDYSKVPFVLGLVLCALRLIRAPLTFRRAALLALGAGLLNGLAMGFRNDLLVAVPAFVALLLAFLPHESFRRGWRNAALVGVYLGAFALALSPMLSIYRTGGGSSSQHLMVLGLGEPFNEELGLNDAGMYEWGYGYRDEFAHAMISGHATRRLGANTFLQIYGVDYDNAGSDYLGQIARNFPADLLARGYASALRVLQLPYNQRLMLPQQQYLRLPHRVFVIRDRFQRALAPVWLAIVGLTVFGLTVMSVRVGLFAVLFVLYLSAYPAIQFGERHYFHLEFISWWALGFAVSQGAAAVRHSMQGGFRPWLESIRPERGWKTGFSRAIALWSVALVLCVGPLFALRRFQQGHLRALFQQYLDAPVDAAALHPVPQGNGYVRFVPPMTEKVTHAVENSDAVRPELFQLEFGGPACDSLKLDAVFRYDASEPGYDFSRTLAVQPPLSSTPLRMVFPAYFHRAVPDENGRLVARYAFTGVDIPERAQACLTRFAHVADPDRVPLMLELKLPPRWESADLFQTIDGFESRTNPEQTPQVYTFPADLEVGRQLLMQPVAPLDAAAIFRRSPTLDTTQATWTNQGVGGVGGKGPFLYLFEMSPIPLQEGQLALIQGEIRRGGISFGLVSEGAWIAQTGVTRPGLFTVVVRVPTSGTHSLVLANNLTGASLQSDVRIDRVGWLR